MNAETRERPDLAGFAEAIMRCWPEGDVDGGDLQEIAIKHGLLRPETRTELCEPECDCAGMFDGGDEWTCYRRVTFDASPKPSRAEPVEHPAKPDLLTLVKIAANLLTEGLSGYSDDWPKTMPKAALQAIDRHNERQRLWALDIKRVCDNLRPRLNSAAPPPPAVSLPDGWPWNEQARQELMWVLQNYSLTFPDTTEAAQSLVRWLDQSPEQGGQG